MADIYFAPGDTDAPTTPIDRQILILPDLQANKVYYIGVSQYNTGTGTYRIKVSRGDTQAPTTPKNLTLTSNADGKVTFTWSPSTDDTAVSGYSLYRDGVWVASVADSVYECSDSGLSASTTYSYTVRAFDEELNESMDSDPVSVTTEADTKAPTAPADLAAAASSLSGWSVKLTWTAATDNFGVAGYNIYIGNTEVGSSKDTSYTCIGLRPGTTYSFTVKAEDWGNNESVASNPVTVKTLDDDYGDNISSAQSINIETQAAGTINYVGDVDYFRFTPDISGKYRIIGTGNTNGVHGYLYNDIGTQMAEDGYGSFSITQSLQGNKVYYIKVKSYNDSRTGTYSIKVIHVDTQPPDAIKDLALGSKKDGDVSFTWSASNDNIGVTGYELYRDGTQVATVAGSVYTCSDSGLKPLTTYSYSVRAFDAEGNRSLDSNLVSVTTEVDTQAPEAPNDLEVYVETGHAVSMTWKEATDNFSVEGYDIFIGDNKVASTTDTSYEYEGLIPGTTYTFTVKAKDWGNKESAASNPVTVTTYNDDYGDNRSSAQSIELETQVDGVTNFPYDEDYLKFTTDIDGTYRIKGTGNAYIVYLFDDAGTQIAYACSDRSGNFLITKALKANKVYYISLEGYYEGSYTIKVLHEDTQKPTAPSNLELVSKTDGSALFTWLPAIGKVGIVGYELCRNGKVVATVTGSVYSCSDLGLSPLTTYSYTVRAFDADGNRSLDSNPVSVTTEADTKAPTAPTNLAAPNVKGWTVNLTWTASTDNFSVSGYDIFNGDNYAGSSTVTNYTCVGLKPGTSYTFTVKAKDSGNNISAASNAVIAKTLDDDYGDDMSSAKSISIEAQVNGVINYKGDVDFFKFTPGIDDLYKIKSTGIKYCSCYLYDNAGNLINTYKGYGQDSCKKPQQDSIW